MNMSVNKDEIPKFKLKELAYALKWKEKKPESWRNADIIFLHKEGNQGEIRTQVCLYLT